MNTRRALLAGALNWLFVFTSFAAMAVLPALQNSLNTQAALLSLLIIPSSIAAASFYYKKAKRPHGLVLGLMMTATAYLLDALITVPLVELPQGRSYLSFYSYPGLYVLGAVSIASVYGYWNVKIKAPKSASSY